MLGEQGFVGMLEHLMARIVDRRIGLDRSGEMPYIGVGQKFRFIWIPSSRLHVCNAYRNTLKTLIIADTGKVYVFGTPSNWG